MASLTLPSKILIATIVVVGSGSLAWNVGLKDVVNNHKPSADPTHFAQDSGHEHATEHAENDWKLNGEVVGTEHNPLKVSVVSFHGYAPALLANGASLKTAKDSIYDKLGLTVEFVIQDDIPTLTTIFESKAAHCAWRTSDFWAQEQPNLRNNGLDARGVLIVDNTQGGDALIARDPSIKSVEDLAGHSVALLEFTPSHGMLIDAVNNSSLSAKKRQSIKNVFVNADEGTGGVRAAFSSGNVDAAVLWDPDLSLALKATPGAHVVYSTKTATNLIYDLIVCDQRVLKEQGNEVAINKFVEGWIDGVEEAKHQPDAAVNALLKTEPVFIQLEKDQGRDFIKGLFTNVVWTGLDDNIRILGLTGDTNHYERVYSQFDQIYRGIGALSNPKSPVINPQDSFDYRFVKRLMKSKPEAAVEAAKPQFTFNQKEAQKLVSTESATITKPVVITFASGSAALSKRAESVLDDEMAPLIESNGAAYFAVSGHTDSTGSRAANIKLSQARAQTVVNYLVKEWEFDAARFVVVGVGSDKPLCDEKHPDADVTLEQCRETNRATRLAVISR